MTTKDRNKDAGRGKDKTTETTSPRERTQDPEAQLTADDENQLDQIDNNILIEEELNVDQRIPLAGRDAKQERELRKAVKAAVRTPQQSRAALRRKTRIFYDLQRLRIQTAGRTYKRATDIELHELDLQVLEGRASELHMAERHALADIRVHLSTMAAYTQILADSTTYRGIGPTLAAVILSEVDITRCDTVSALWRFAGLSVVPSHRCKTCFDPVSESKEALHSFVHDYNRKEKCPLGRLIRSDQVMESSKAERGVKGEKLPYNRFLKTKMVGVMSGCLLKSGSPFRKFYDDYKHRLTSANWGRNDGHRHQAALRYMTKMVLKSIWDAWRRLEGLAVREDYATDYLHKQHSGSAA